MDAYRESRSSIQHELGCIVNGFKNFKRRSVYLLNNRWVINCAGNENKRQNFTMSFTALSLGFVTPSLEVK